MSPLFDKETLYNDIIARVSRETGVPTAIIKGFVGLESNFNEKSYRAEPQLKPPDASYGLAQILVATARGVGFQGEAKELFEPYKSLLYGARFIRQIAKRYTGALDVISAYNCGYPRKIQNTTAFIANIYKYPIGYREKPPQGWVYANEPYVRRVTAYIAYYKAGEENDTAKAGLILARLRGRDLDGAYALSEQTVEAIKFDVSEILSAATPDRKPETKKLVAETPIVPPAPAVKRLTAWETVIQFLKELI